MAIWLPQNPIEQERMLAWARERLPIRDFGPAYPIGVVRGGELVAVAVYHNMREASIEASFASDDPRWATRQTLTYLLSWPFLSHSHVRRLQVVIARSNKRSRKLAEGVGMRREGMMSDFYERDDGILHALTRKQWERSRWYVETEHRRAA